MTAVFTTLYSACRVAATWWKTQNGASEVNPPACNMQPWPMSQDRASPLEIIAWGRKYPKDTFLGKYLTIQKNPPPPTKIINLQCNIYGVIGVIPYISEAIVMGESHARSFPTGMKLLLGLITTTSDGLQLWSGDSVQIHCWHCQSSSQNAFLELHVQWWWLGSARPEVQVSNAHRLSTLSLVATICGHANSCLCRRL